MQQAQTNYVPTPAPVWLPLFITAFGAKGLVALAWWLGSLHSNRIRKLLGGYPILEVIGDAGAGKSCLMQTLWRLLGETEGRHADSARMTATAFMIHLSAPTNWPVVVEDEWAPDAPFNMHLMSGCYGGLLGSIQRSPQTEAVSVRCKGGLAVVGQQHYGLRGKTVQIFLAREQQSAESRTALLQLLEMPIEEMATFKAQAEASAHQVIGVLRQTVQLYMDAMAEDIGKSYLPNEGRNHAILRSLTTVATALFGLTADQSAMAHREIHEMARSSCCPY